MKKEISPRAVGGTLSAREIIANLRKEQEEQHQTSEIVGDTAIKDDQSAEKENRKLKTIRAKIQQTIGFEYQIALVINSLGGDAGEITGLQNQKTYINHKNIQRHAEQVGNSFIEARKEIDNIVKEESDILNVSSIAEFIKNDLFNQTSEVKNYEKYLGQTKDIVDSNVVLQEKIESFGINVPDDENLSYVNLITTLEEVKKATHDKIMLLKNKTPEGKEEFSNYLEGEIKKAKIMNYKMEVAGNSLLFYKDDDYQSYETAIKENPISLYSESYGLKVNNPILKEDLIDIVKFEKLSQRFGKDTVKKTISRLLAQKAINRVYSLKVEEDLSVENFLNKTNPKKTEENKKRLNDFRQNEVQALYKVLKDKNDFLKDNRFFESLASFFGRNFYELDETKNTIGHIQEKNPPRERYNLEYYQRVLNYRPFDNDVFQELIENKIKETKELTVAISEAKNITDLSLIKEKYFSEYGEYLKSTISSSSQKNQDLIDKLHFTHARMNMGSPYHLNINYDREEMRDKILKQINNNKKNRDEVRQKLQEIIEKNLDLQILKQKLNTEINPDSSLDDF